MSTLGGSTTGLAVDDETGVVVALPGVVLTGTEVVVLLVGEVVQEQTDVDVAGFDDLSGGLLEPISAG
ncbi:hypothetical protein GCM10027190_21090 [Spirosoma areae]